MSKSMPLTKRNFTAHPCAGFPEGSLAVGGVAVAAGGLLWDRLGGTALSWVMRISAVIPPSECDN